ncbi:hypothetical protein ACW9H6_02615 [Pseudomonas sp. SDO528_S397]
MKTLNSGSLSLLLICCVLSTGASLEALAAGDGVIVIERTVQGHMVGRSPGVDPNPTTVNANPSAHVLRATGELGDTDFASISSGASLNRNLLPSGTLPGLGNPGGAVNLGGGGAGSRGNAGLGGQINGSIARGMAPLNSIGDMMGGR